MARVMYEYPVKDIYSKIGKNSEFGFCTPWRNQVHRKVRQMYCTHYRSGHEAAREVFTKKFAYVEKKYYLCTAKREIPFSQCKTL